MSAKFDVKMTGKILYDFLMTHTYRSFSGFFSIILGILGVVLTVATFGKTETMISVVYGVFSVYFLCYQPITLYMRAVNQVKRNPMYREPMHYEISDEGIKSSQNDANVLIPWENIVKVTESKYSLLLYTGKISSFVLPKENIGEQITIVEGLLKKHLEAEQIKIK